MAPRQASVAKDTGPPVKGRPTRAEAIAKWQAAHKDSEEGEKFAEQMALEIVENAADVVAGHYFDKIAIPYTSQYMFQQVLELMQIVFIERDNGDDSPSDIQSWEPDEEPQPLEIDSLARGAVPVRAKSTASPPATGTESASTNRRTPLNRRAPGRGAGSDRKPKEPKEDPKPAVQEDLATTTSSMGRSSVAPKPAGKRRAKEKEEDPKAEEEKRQQLAKRQEALEQREKERQEAEAAERTAKLLSSLKMSGKEFTVDGTGRVIPIKNVETRPPTQMVELGMGIREDRERAEKEAEDEIAREAAAKAKRSNYTSSARPKKKQAPRAPKVPPGAFVPPDDRAGPMVDNTSLSPSGGVMMRAQEVSLRNDLKTPVGKMTKSEFRNMVDTADLQDFKSKK